MAEQQMAEQQMATTAAAGGVIVDNFGQASSSSSKGKRSRTGDASKKRKKRRKLEQLSFDATTAIAAAADINDKCNNNSSSSHIHIDNMKPMIYNNNPRLPLEPPPNEQSHCNQTAQQQQVIITEQATGPPSSSSSSSSGGGPNCYQVQMKDFELLKVLGTGAYGKVFLVRKLTGHDKSKLYAMKILRKEIVAQKTKTLDHTKTERKVLESVRNEPFLVTMHYAFQTKTKLHLILDYVNGGELFTHLYQRDHFKEDDVKIYIGELILALEKLHKVSLIGLVVPYSFVAATATPSLVVERPGHQLFYHRLSSPSGGAAT